MKASRKCVLQRYGDQYLSPEPRQFATKSKGAQEAHEAIRPAGTKMQTADELGLSGREQRLYQMIWMRTIASQAIKMVGLDNLTQSPLQIVTRTSDTAL